MKRIFAAVLFLTAAVPVVAAGPADKQDAVSALEQDVKTNPNNPELWLHLGFAYRKVDQLDKAQAAFEKVSALDANNKDSLYMLGLIYEKKQQKADALKVWKHYLIIETDPEKRAVADKHIHQLSQ